MSDLFQLLDGGVQAGSYVESGVVVSALGGGKFTVSVNGVLGDIESTVPAHILTPGARVVINRTATGRYIIGTTSQFATQQSKEVIIDG